MWQKCFLAGLPASANLCPRVAGQQPGRHAHNMPRAGCEKALAGIAAGLCRVHHHGFAHRDIKPHHFLHQGKSTDWVVKLVDFDSALPPGEVVRMPPTLAYSPFFPQWNHFTLQELDIFAFMQSFQEVLDKCQCCNTLKAVGHSLLDSMKPPGHRTLDLMEGG